MHAAYAALEASTCKLAVFAVVTLRPAAMKREIRISPKVHWNREGQRWHHVDLLLQDDQAWAEEASMSHSLTA